MANDLLRAAERAAVTSLKADAPLAQIVAKDSIDPIAEDPAWPFVRLDGTQSLPQGRGCTARAEISFMVHSFAKPRYVGNDPKNGGLLETARDHAARLNTAVVEALHDHAYTLDGRRYSFSVRSSRLMQDGAERDAYHGIASVVARAFTIVSVFERLFEVEEGQRASNGWHQSIWPGELGLEFMTGTDVNLYWGVKPPKSGSTARSGSLWAVSAAQQVNGS